MIFWELFLTFLKIGAFTFGGGYAMLPLIQEEAVAHGWMTMEELVNFIAVSESTPGPFAINISTYVGAETAGVAGAACATLGVALPSFVVILLVARWFLAFKNSRVVSGVMTGLRPAVIGLIAAAALSVGATVFCPSGGFVPDYMTLCAAGIFLVMLVLEFKKLHPIAIIVLSAVLGIAAGFVGEYLPAGWRLF